MIGKVIKNNYRIMDEIGQGSVATVYLAKDMARNLVVALKIIHPEQAAEGQFLQRFQREAKLLQMLSSPQAVKVFDYGEDEGLNFIVLEYVQARTLAIILEEKGPLEFNPALDIAKQIALCLVDAHAKSIVHRDLRPANIMVTAEETVKVMDFGIAQGAELSRLTATGVLGSPHYLSPEQTSGREVDSRSDIYSLGVILFEMLSGRKPYNADSATDIVLAHLHEPIPSLHQLDERIPLEIDELVRKCLAKKPGDRYQSAAEFLEAIDGTLRAIAKRKEGVLMGMEAALAGQTLGAYRIIEQIGRGGMATVYKAYEPALDRNVAIKILPQYFAHDPDFVKRFKREAKAVAKLNHPNILPIYSFGQEAGLSYIAMRYVEAGTLKEMLGRPYDLRNTADILGQIGRALDYAHQQGVVHRDVKPTNVLMAEGKWALLTDFGLARIVESSVQITKTGVGVGTPAYMSPEQGQGIKVDARTDIYSLGVVLYEMVTGKVPYEAETPMAVVLKHITAPLPLPREVNPNLPEAIERVILKAMAKAPEDRYQTAGEMVEALERAVAEAPTVEMPEVKPMPVEEVPAAVVAEPTPAPAVAVPVEAPPVAKKGLPGWVWGVVGALVLLIAAGGVFLATRGGEPSPTPEATAALIATPLVSPEPQAPISPGERPAETREVKPCDWEGLGPGLCIYPVGGGAPTKILQDAGLETMSPASWRPDGQQIAFSAIKPGEDPGRDTTIYIVNADGNGLTELPSLGNDINPAWSPDGEWLAFHSNCSLAIMHPDGSDPAVIWHSEGRTCTSEPQWSPDSQWIVVFMQMEAGGEWTFPMTRELWVISRDGSAVTTVGTITHENDSCVWPDVAFSPDGRQVAYFDADCQPWVVNADGSGQAVPLDDFPYWWTSASSPQWGGEMGALPAPIPPSPAKLVSPGEPPMGAREVSPCEWDNRGPGLCLYPLGDGEPTKILEDTELVTSEGGPPSWSPNGQQIAFSAIKPGERPDHDSNIYIVNTDGTGLTELPQVGNDVRPGWSPDGEWVAFHSSGALAMMHPDGSDPTVIWRGEGCTEEPQWSPDSQWIAVLMQIGGCEWSFPMTREVWVISRDGATINTIAAMTHENGECVWSEVAFSPDGEQVAYNDANCKPWMVNADGSGQAMPLEGFPFWWKSTVHPQWGGERKAPPAAAPPGAPMPTPIPQAAVVSEEFTVTVVESSPLYPAWDTWFDLDTGDQLQVQSENPVDVFYGKPVGFRGPEAEGALQFVRYRLTFAQEVELAEVVMEAAATNNAYMRLYDHEGREIVSKGPFGQGNVIHTETLVAPNPRGKEFFLEIENDVTHWFCIMHLSIRARTSTGPPPPEGAPAPADPWGQVVVPPGDTIHIGLVADFSGAVNWFGPMNENAVQMAMDDQGPVKGFPVSFMSADGGCNHEMGAAAAQAMISDPLIVGVIGHTCSTSCGEGAPVYEGAHLVMISPSCTGPDLSGPGFQVFNRVATREDQGGDERNKEPVNTDVYQDFARRYQDRYGQSLDSLDMGFYAAYAYDAAVILVKAIERVAVVDGAGNLVIGRQALANAVRATPGHQGMTGLISFDERGDRLP